VADERSASKGGSDKDMREGTKAAQDLLVHATEAQTASYIHHRIGKLVKPTK